MPATQLQNDIVNLTQFCETCSNARKLLSDVRLQLIAASNAWPAYNTLVAQITALQVQTLITLLLTQCQVDTQAKLTQLQQS